MKNRRRNAINQSFATPWILLIHRQCAGFWGLYLQTLKLKSLPGRGFRQVALAFFSVQDLGFRVCTYKPWTEREPSSSAFGRGMGSASARSIVMFREFPSLGGSAPASSERQLISARDLCAETLPAPASSSSTTSEEALHANLATCLVPVQF